MVHHCLRRAERRRPQTYLCGAQVPSSWTHVAEAPGEAPGYQDTCSRGWRVHGGERFLNAGIHQLLQKRGGAMNYPQTLSPKKIRELRKLSLGRAIPVGAYHTSTKIGVISISTSRPSMGGAVQSFRLKARNGWRWWELSGSNSYGGCVYLHGAGVLIVRTILSIVVLLPLPLSLFAAKRSSVPQKPKLSRTSTVKKTTSESVGARSSPT